MSDCGNMAPSLRSLGKRLGGVQEELLGQSADELDRLNAEMERLTLLVNHSFNEGWETSRAVKTHVYEAWLKSETLKALKANNDGPDASSAMEDIELGKALDKQ